MKRIGIMGGTFNPIHNGHLAIAEAARAQFSLEKVLFMPSGVPYMKERQKVMPIDIRCEMTALAIADYPYFELSDLEASDAVHGKNTYTFETLQKLRYADPEASYYFILGADSLYAIENWKNPTVIFQNCTILAAVRAAGSELDTRPRHTFTGEASKPTKSDAHAQNKSAWQHLCRQILYLREKYHASIELLEFAEMDISSTQIREKAQHGESVCGLVPEAVERYIEKHELYKR